ncbi:sterol O-acyltransferase 1-like [Symsagittifera roscoffensis]|uniref:sterol O-acyltransferase 1-like n=1 Tax=Symsagittifera roscoffensis TaxID=84072 RepID=UPI00307C6C83
MSLYGKYVEPTYDGMSNESMMELNLDDLRRRLIHKIELEVKETFESYSTRDDFLLRARGEEGGGGDSNYGGSMTDLNSASVGEGVIPEQHQADEVEKYKEKPKRFASKQFKPRESILSVLLRQSKNIRTIYNIFAAILIHLFISTCVNDWINSRSIVQNMEIIWWNFGNFPTVVSIWLMMMVSTLLVVYPLYNFWATTRRALLKDERVFDCVFLALYCGYQIGFFILPAYMCRVTYQLPPASTLIVILEQLRLLMKVHSFVRENIPRSMRYDPKKNVTTPTGIFQIDDSEESQQLENIACPNFSCYLYFLFAPTLLYSEEQFKTKIVDDSEESQQLENIACPNFSCYLYFLFAPTLLYRDSYPMTESIDWNFVRSNFVQTLVCILYTAFIFTRFIFPIFSEFGNHQFDWEHSLQSVFSMVLPGTLLLVLFHFMFLHSWLNACAEMLRFADRIFYRDWWTSTSYGQYYRTWNVVVHDFLKAYIMYDSELLLVRLLGNKRSKQVHFLSIMFTFLVSALVHEYVIIMAVGFFFPILFLMFSGCGFWFMILVQNNRFDRFQNTIFWFLLTIGMGVLLSWYCQEWYAQQNCPHNGESILDYLIPRSVACYWGS